jgi:hypothetical protein
MGDGGLPVQVQDRPVTGKQPGRAAPRPATKPVADDRTPATNGELAAAGVRDEAMPRMTAADRHGPHLRRRPPPGNLTGRRGAALIPPILLAAGLNAAAVAGLAYIAGFHAVYTALTRIQWPPLCAMPAALAMSATGYYYAYRGIYTAEGGYQLSRRELTAMVAVGFGGLFSTGGMRPDGLVLQASGASRRGAMVRLSTLAGMEQAMLALYGCAASIAWLCLGRPGVPISFTLPWAVIPLPAFAAAFWLDSR